MPVADVLADDGIRHTLWVIDDAQRIAAISEVFGAMPHAVHCRRSSPFGCRLARGCRPTCAAATRRPGGRIFPVGHLPGVADADHGLQPRGAGSERPVRQDAFLAAVGERYTVTASDARVRPQRSGVCGMYLQGRWYRLEIQPGLVPASDPVRRLDVSVLCRAASRAGAGITDLRRDTRIEFRRWHARACGTRAAGGQRRNGPRLRHVSDADGRSDGGGRRGSGHATEVHVVRTEAG
jgi:hypothetical protein